MSEIYNCLTKLYELTRNPKYALDIADLCVNSKMKENIEYATSIYKNLGDSYQLHNTEFPEHYRGTMNDLLDVKRIDLSTYEKRGKSLSVIIPTMWKAPKNYFIHNLDHLVNSIGFGSVKEIIIINNNPIGSELECFVKKEYPQIKIIDNEKNIGVNPAWNQGMELASGEFYLLLNDDCLLDYKIIESCVSILVQDKSVGIVNCHTKKVHICNYIERPVSKHIDYVNHLGANPNGWFIMGRTEDYEPIPNQLVYFYGDDLIHYRVKRKKKRIVKLVSDFISHDVSTTVNDLDLYRKGLLESEGVIYRSIIGA